MSPDLLGVVEELLLTGNSHSVAALADIFEDAGKQEVATKLREGRLFWRHPDPEFVPVSIIPIGGKFRMIRDGAVAVKEAEHLEEVFSIQTGKSFGHTWVLPVEDGE